MLELKIILKNIYRNTDKTNSVRVIKICINQQYIRFNPLTETVFYFNCDKLEHLKYDGWAYLSDSPRSHFSLNAFSIIDCSFFEILYSSFLKN